MKEAHTNPDPSLWQGRISGRQEYLHEKVLLWNPAEGITFSLDQNTFVLLGYACDEGIRRNGGRPGAGEGPDAIRLELGKMASHLSGSDRILDMGNIHCLEGDLESAQSLLATKVKDIITLGGFSLLLGGGHDISYGHYRGLRKALDPSLTLGIINFDAHFDLRTHEQGNHSGSPFYQIAGDCKKEGAAFHYLCLGIRKEANPAELFDRANELGVQYVELPGFSINLLREVKNALSEFLSKTDRVYVTVDMDGFSSAFAPGVSAAFPNGFTPEIVLNCLKQIISTGKLLGLDVAETSPKWDRDQQTAKLAAGIIHFVMHEQSLL